LLYRRLEYCRQALSPCYDMDMRMLVAGSRQVWLADAD
jgi:hypothetical protein